MDIILVQTKTKPKSQRAVADCQTARLLHSFSSRGYGNISSLLQTQRTRYKLSDSSSAINALNKCVINSVTLECLSKISDLASNNSISLSWVPGHCKGNEMADALARRGIEGNTFIKAYIPNSFIKKTINNNVYADSLHTWKVSKVNI